MPFFFVSPNCYFAMPSQGIFHCPADWCDTANMTRQSYTNKVVYHPHWILMLQTVNNTCPTGLSILMLWLADSSKLDSWIENHFLPLEFQLVACWVLWSFSTFQSFQLAACWVCDHLFGVSVGGLLSILFGKGKGNRDQFSVFFDKGNIWG
jgi:hypothetical protein